MTEGKYSAAGVVAQYATIDKTVEQNWCIVEPAPFTVSGYNEIIATAHTKVEAEQLAQDTYRTKKWRKRCAVVRRSDLNIVEAKPKKGKTK